MSKYSHNARPRRWLARTAISTLALCGGLLAASVPAPAFAVAGEDVAYNALDLAQEFLNIQVVEEVDIEIQPGLHIKCVLSVTPGAVTYGPDPNSVGNWLESGALVVESSCPDQHIKTLNATVRIVDGGIISHTGIATRSTGGNYASAIATLQFPLAEEPGPEITWYFSGYVTSTTNTTTRACTKLVANIFTRSLTRGRC